MKKFIYTFSQTVPKQNIFSYQKGTSLLILATIILFVSTFSAETFASTANRTNLDNMSPSRSKSTYTLVARQDTHRKKIEALPEGKAIGVMTVSG
ncbi:MAG: hypothetical protein ABL927_08715, partial [Bdellovibrionales bacterium]